MIANHGDSTPEDDLRDLYDNTKIWGSYIKLVMKLGLVSLKHSKYKLSFLNKASVISHE